MFPKSILDLQLRHEKCELHQDKQAQKFFSCKWSGLNQTGCLKNYSTYKIFWKYLQIIVLLDMVLQDGNIINNLLWEKWLP